VISTSTGTERNSRMTLPQTRNFARQCEPARSSPSVALATHSREFYRDTSSTFGVENFRREKRKRPRGYVRRRGLAPSESTEHGQGRHAVSQAVRNRTQNAHARRVVPVSALRLVAMTKQVRPYGAGTSIVVKLPQPIGRLITQTGRRAPQDNPAAHRCNISS